MKNPILAKNIGLYRANPTGVVRSEDCVFKFLDPSIKEEMQNKVSSFYTAWEKYIGDTTLYDEENNALPGCAITETISW